MTTEIVDPQSLRLHPLLESMPEADPELIISMTADIEERGIDQPLIVDEKCKLVIDGRLRWQIARSIDLPVAVVRRSSSEAATIIVQSLLQRRHLTLSARVWDIYPLFSAMLREHAGRPGNSVRRTQLTREQLGKKIGVGVSLIAQAREVQKLFEKYPQLRARYEAMLRAGEISLAGVCKGIPGEVATKGKPRLVQAELDLWTDKIRPISDRRKFAGWQRTSPDTRTYVASEIATNIAQHWPIEVKERIYVTLRADLKGAPS